MGKDNIRYLQKDGRCGQTGPVRKKRGDLLAKQLGSATVKGIPDAEQEHVAATRLAASFFLIACYGANQLARSKGKKRLYK